MQVEQDAGVRKIRSITEDVAGEIAERGIGGVIDLSSAAKYSEKDFTAGPPRGQRARRRGALARRTDSGVKGDCAEGPHFEIYRVVAYGGH
jgi:hypothetical protein